MATVWVLDDVRWRGDHSRPFRASTVGPDDGVTPDQLPTSISEPPARSGSDEPPGAAPNAAASAATTATAAMTGVRGETSPADA